MTIENTPRFSAVGTVEVDDPTAGELYIGQGWTAA